MPDLPYWPLVLPRGHSLIPAQFPTIRRRWRRRGNGWAAAARTSLSGTATCCLGLLATLGVPLSGRAEVASRAQVSLVSNLPPVHASAALIAEASHRFAIPERWIWAVIQVESSGNAHAISPRGALGLMQIMPQTWVDLSVRYDLGLDPFDPQDNVMAGTAYLREMLDRFGSEGVFAAYNTGPKRYEEHLTAGRPLPDETQSYVARLAPLIASEQRELEISATRKTVDWRQATVFVQRSGGQPASGPSAFLERLVSSSKAVPQGDTLSRVPRATELFVKRSDEVKSR
jgi:hypothetical protein